MMMMMKLREKSKRATPSQEQKPLSPQPYIIAISFSLITNTGLSHLMEPLKRETTLASSHSSTCQLRR